MSPLKFAKPLKRKTVKRKKRLAQNLKTKAVREAVFERDGYTCRCCQMRAAESMHEIRPRSLGGKRSLENSIAVCGSGTTGCHGKLQQLKICVHYLHPTDGANHTIGFLDKDYVWTS